MVEGGVLAVRSDWERARRTGVPEAVLCVRKSPAQIAAIVDDAARRRRPLFLTRLEPGLEAALPKRARARLDYDPLSETAMLGRPRATGAGCRVAVVAAGTSDLRVAREAQRTLAFHGVEAPLFADVGVAGLWRLMGVLPALRRAHVVIAVAGMEGALFSVVAGLVRAPVIAVPTSVGYGVATGGETAMRAALASCAPGVVTVNIDNGFGAAGAAVKIAALARPPRAARR